MKTAQIQVFFLTSWLYLQGVIDQIFAVLRRVPVHTYPTCFYRTLHSMREHNQLVRVFAVAATLTNAPYSEVVHERRIYFKGDRRLFGGRQLGKFLVSFLLEHLIVRVHLTRSLPAKSNLIVNPLVKLYQFDLFGLPNHNHRSFALSRTNSHTVGIVRGHSSHNTLSLAQFSTSIVQRHDWNDTRLLGTLDEVEIASRVFDFDGIEHDGEVLKGRRVPGDVNIAATAYNERGLELRGKFWIKPPCIRFILAPYVLIYRLIAILERLRVLTMPTGRHYPNLELINRAGLSWDEAHYLMRLCCGEQFSEEIS